jgi:hypothetical protein
MCAMSAATAFLAGPFSGRPGQRKERARSSEAAIGARIHPA